MGKSGVMGKAITVRLDEADHAALHRQAERLQVRPGNAAGIGLPVKVMA